MITLKQLVDEQNFTGLSDVEVIRKFFVLNDMEEEGMDLIHTLTKSKVEKLKHKNRVVEEWTSHLPSKHLYENYDLDTADRLHTLELDYLSHGCELSDSRLAWARENIPNIKMPQIYFWPLIEYLDDKDIRFKGERPLKCKTFGWYV